MEDCSAQLGHCRVWAKGLRNVEGVSQVELMRLISTTVLERSRSD